MTFVFVDVELFHDNVVKELAFYNNERVDSYTFGPPYTFQSCSKEERKQNSWLTQNLHLIGWNAGQLPYTELTDVVVKYIHIDEFYAKGTEKCKMLETIFPVEFTNIEEFGCPKLGEISKDAGKCRSFPYRHDKILHCAERKARAYGVWLEDFLDLFKVL